MFSSKIKSVLKKNHFDFNKYQLLQRQKLNVRKKFIQLNYIHNVRQNDLANLVLQS